MTETDVEPLKWIGSRAETPFGEYSIEPRLKGDDFVWTWFFNQGHANELEGGGVYPTEKDAMAAADSDFAERVRAVLLPPSEGAKTETDDDLYYMCQTDFDHELGFASGGNRVFPSLEDAKENLKCWRGCGIVAVRVEFVSIAEEGTGL